MADWDRNQNNGPQGERDWRQGHATPQGEMAPRHLDSAGRFGGGPPEPRGPRDEPRSRMPQDARLMGSQTGRTFTPGGDAAAGYGEGGDTSYGQMSSGSSASGLGGYSGADVGGFGQPVQNSQWGQGGYGPLNQGIDYGQDGGRFGPRGYESGNFGPTPGPRGPEAAGAGAAHHHDEHHVHYRSWRDTQLASHDRDYARWRDQQARRYDEDYGSWRNERHAAFSREFEGWRAGRGGQSSGYAADAPSAAPGTAASVNPSERTAYGDAAEPQGYAHGANPTLAKIADGHEGRHHHHHDDDADRDRTPGHDSAEKK